MGEKTIITPEQLAEFNRTLKAEHDEISRREAPQSANYQARQSAERDKATRSTPTPAPSAPTEEAPPE